MEAARRFDAEFRPRWPNAADKVSTDLDQLLRFFDYPAQHWQHLKTTNPISVNRPWRYELAKVA